MILDEVWMILTTITLMKVRRGCYDTKKVRGGCYDTKKADGTDHITNVAPRGALHNAET